MPEEASKEPSPPVPPGGLKGVLARVDGFQQQRSQLAFPVAVVKKFGDDRAGKLAAQMAYYGFFSLFPLMLVFVAVLGFVLQNNSDLQREVVDSVFARLPFIGGQIQGEVGTVRGSGLALVVGIVGALWGGLAVMQATQDAMNEVWGVPMKDRPNFLTSRLRSIIMLVVLGVGIVGSTLVAGVATSITGRSVVLQIGALAVTVLVNLVLFMAAFRVLTVRSVALGDLLPGAMVAAVVSTVLQSVGGYLLSNQLGDASEVYGTFATVIVLLGWLSLQAQVTLFAAEINVVRVRGMWPRSLLQEPLSEADKQVLTDVAKVEERHPAQEITVEFEPQPEAEAASPEPEPVPPASPDGNGQSFQPPAGPTPTPVRRATKAKPATAGAAKPTKAAKTAKSPAAAKKALARATKSGATAAKSGARAGKMTRAPRKP